MNFIEVKLSRGEKMRMSCRFWELISIVSLILPVELVENWFSSLLYIDLLIDTQVLQYACMWI